MNRDKVIVRTSIIGIIANVFLAAFKAAVGLISHSIAVTLYAGITSAVESIKKIIHPEAFPDYEVVIAPDVDISD